MRRTLLCSAAVLFAAGVQAQTINILLQDEETFPPTAGSYNDFSNTDDIDPNSLVKLSTGSYVFFDSEGTGDPFGTGPDLTGDGGDNVTLFDPDDPGGGINRFEVILPETGATSLNSVIGVTSTDIRVSDIVVNSNDDLYLGVSNGDTAVDPHPHYIVKLPSTGADTWGAPILVADDTRVGTSGLASQIDLAIKEDGGTDTIYFVVDDEAADSEAANDASNFIYSLPGTAVNDVAPTALPNSDFASLMTALGGVGGTDKTDVDNLAYIPSTDQLWISNGGNTDNDVSRGDIATYDLTTNTYSAIIDASTLPGTPTASVIAYNPSNSSVGVFWYIGASSNSPAENDRIDRFDTAGTFIETVVTEDDINVVDSNVGDMNQFGSAFEIDAAGNYYIFEGGDPEAIWEIVPAPVSSVTNWDLY